MKIIILTGDGPESEDELTMYQYSKRKVYKNLHPDRIYKTTEPINPAKNFDAWMDHVFLARNHFLTQ